jgi:hypothetical protein
MTVFRKLVRNRIGGLENSNKDDKTVENYDNHPFPHPSIASTGAATFIGSGMSKSGFNGFQSEPLRMNER